MDTCTPDGHNWVLKASGDHHYSTHRCQKPIFSRQTIYPHTGWLITEFWDDWYCSKCRKVERTYTPNSTFEKYLEANPNQVIWDHINRKFITKDKV